MTPTPTIRRLHALDGAQLDQLAALTVDCVEGGASIGFMHPLTHERAVAAYRRRRSPRLIAAREEIREP